MNDLARDWIRIFPLESLHDRVAPTFLRLVGERFPFPGGPRPRKPGSPSAIAGSAHATTSPSIDGPAQAVLGCIENALVWVVWYARIPSGSHLTEMLALICSAYGTWKTREASSAGRKYPSACLPLCHPEGPCFDSFRTLSAHWILCLS
jgi:hypothetical protein